jgi:hypothetical protein
MVEGVVETITLAQKIGALNYVTLAVLFFLALYRGWLVLGPTNKKLEERYAKLEVESAARLAEVKADYEKRLLKYEASNTKWEDMAIRATGLTEIVVTAKKKEPRDDVA